MDKSKEKFKEKAKESIKVPIIGNAVMDLLSNRAYQRVMIYSSLDESQSDSDKLKKAKAVVKENLNDAC